MKTTLDWATPAMLFASAAVIYFHEQYGSAFICAACAGFCLGLVCAKYVVRRW